MKTYLYKMECLTNMHVGSGDESYNLVDREVQKDVVTRCSLHPRLRYKGRFENTCRKRADEEFILKTFGGEKDHTKSDIGKRDYCQRNSAAHGAS